MENNPPDRRLAPVLEQKDALPGAKNHPAFAHGIDI